MPRSTEYSRIHRSSSAAKFEDYRTKMAPMIAKYGGRYLTSSKKSGPKQVAISPRRVAAGACGHIEFPNMAALNALYRSPEYQPLIALRQAAAADVLITPEGA